MATEPHATVAAPTGLALDPFRFQPGVASRIMGLGGSDPGYNPDYAFHTDYVPVAPGYANFYLRFHGLRARQGTLVIRVHMLPVDEKAHARLVTAERVALNRIVQLGGTYIIQFEAFYGVIYALYGGIHGETDAEAEGLEIVLDRPADPSAEQQVATEGRNTAFGRDQARAVAHLVSCDRATFAHPVTQLCTERQLHERSFAAAVRRLRLEQANGLEQWRQAFVVQALDRYGMLREGARGLCFGTRDGNAPAAVAAAGTELLAIDEGEAQKRVPANLWRTSMGDMAQIRGHLSYRTAPRGELTPDLVNYDFLWSDDLLTRLGTIAEGTRFAEELMACLRPGGFAVHIVPFALDDSQVGPQTFRRCDVERLALLMISRRHEVAMFKIDRERLQLLPSRAPGEPDATLCGIILRRALTIH